MIGLATAALLLLGSPSSPASTDALPGAISRAYLSAQGALREGDDGTALGHWRRARALFQALPSEQRYAHEARDAAVRYELRLAEIARKRFDRITRHAVDAPERVQEKQRMFNLLAGDVNAGGPGAFEGAWRYVIALNPGLRGTQCQRAELIARFHRFLAELPCSSDLSDAECELAKTRGADDDAWRDDVARANAACRG